MRNAILSNNTNTNTIIRETLWRDERDLGRDDKQVIFPQTQFQNDR